MDSHSHNSSTAIPCRPNATGDAYRSNISLVVEAWTQTQSSYRPHFLIVGCPAQIAPMHRQNLAVFRDALQDAPPRMHHTCSNLDRHTVSRAIAAPMRFKLTQVIVACDYREQAHIAPVLQDGLQLLNHKVGWPLRCQIVQGQPAN